MNTVVQKNNGIIVFETEDKSISLPVMVEQDTVWLNRNQMSELFGRDVKTIGKHINNALQEELEEEVTVAKFATVQREGEKRIDDYTLVALTIMIAESRPEEKEMMVSVVMNCMK